MRQQFVNDERTVEYIERYFNPNMQVFGDYRFKGLFS